MNDPIKSMRSDLSAALAARNGPPAADPAEAAEQVTDLRAALARDLDTLRGRVPDRTEVSGQARQLGAAAGVGTAVLALGGVLLKRRSHRREEETAVRAQAVALARELSRLELQPRDLLEESSGGHWGKVLGILGLLAAIAGAIVAAHQRMGGDDEVWDQPWDDAT